MCGGSLLISKVSFCVAGHFLLNYLYNLFLLLCSQQKPNDRSRHLYTIGQEMFYAFKRDRLFNLDRPLKKSIRAPVISKCNAKAVHGTRYSGDISVLLY